MPIIESVMGIQVIGNSGENIIKSPIVEAYIGSSLLDSTEVASDTPTDISTKVEQLMAAKHSHSNKAVLDKFAEGSDGKPTYDGQALGGGSGGASTAEDVSYTNTQLPNVENVKAALDELVPKSHTHATGSNITLADNTEYRLTDVTTLSLSYPTSKFECWMRLTFAASGNITVTLPADTEYLGATPDFKNSDTWELSFKDKVLAAKKVGADDGGAGGENGITPHIGENGNWYIGNTDTGKPSRGEKGAPGAAGESGADGKSAYQIAIDNGFVGSQSEWLASLKGATGASGAPGKDGASGSPGADGITPTIGANGNWYLGSTDTGKPSRGKSAYQYAQDGGYTGTETEFAEKLASGALIVTITDNNGTLSADKTFIDIRDAYIAGTPVYVFYDGLGYPVIAAGADSITFGTILCENDGIDAAVSTFVIQITQYGEVNDISAQIDIPKTLPNPNAITFTGAVTGSYDGSTAMTVNIPSAVTDDHINSLIDTKLGVIENGTY